MPYNNGLLQVVNILQKKKKKQKHVRLCLDSRLEVVTEKWVGLGVGGGWARKEKISPSPHCCTFFS